MAMGRPPRYSAAEMCKTVALHPEPVVAPKDLTTQLDMTADGILARLNTLSADGFLASKTVGSSGKVFWLTDAGKEELNEVL